MFAGGWLVTREPSVVRYKDNLTMEKVEKVES